MFDLIQRHDSELEPLGAAEGEREEPCVSIEHYWPFYSQVFGI